MFDLEEDNLIVSVYDVITDHKSNSRDNSECVEYGVDLPVGVKLEGLSADEEEKRQKLKEKDFPVLKLADRVLLQQDAFTERQKLQNKFDDHCTQEGG